MGSWGSNREYTAHNYDCQKEAKYIFQCVSLLFTKLRAFTGAAFPPLHIFLIRTNFYLENFIFILVLFLMVFYRRNDQNLSNPSSAYPFCKYKLRLYRKIINHVLFVKMFILHVNKRLNHQMEKKNARKYENQKNWDFACIRSIIFDIGLLMV
jgi:hypothetical protein